MTATMTAWLCRAFATPFAIEQAEIAMPQPGPGEVRIRVKAAGISFGETLVLEGGYQKTPPLPYVPCSELSGVIDACGADVATFRPGDAVAAWSVELAGGGLAEYCVMPEQFVHSLPVGMSFADGAGFVMNYWTAFNALYRRAALQPGEVLVVHGATGGAGAAALDVGTAMGATVIATGSDDARLAMVAADHRINHTATPLNAAILELTGGRGADVYFDPVGGDLFDQSLRAIAPGGRVLVVGFTSGTPAQARTGVILVKMIAVIGVEGRLAIERMGEQGWADMAEMLRWAGEGRFHPHTNHVFPFDRAPEAFRFLRDRRHTGKCAVVMD